MEEQQPKTEQKEKKSIVRKILRITFRIVLGLILLVAVVAVLILTPPVQNFIVKKATNWLSEKLDTKVAIGKIYIGFPKKVVVENIYVEDKQNDTLLAGGAVKVDISMLKLLKNEVEVSQVQLSNITAKVKRVLPDTVYNFQFIIDAFDTGDTTAKDPSDTSSMKISVRNVELDKIRLVYDDAVTGNDVAVWLGHFDTEIETFDLDNMRFRVPETNINDIIAKVYQRKPLVEPEEIVEDTATATAAEPMDLDFNFGEFNLSNIRLDYGNDVSAMYTNLDLGKLSIASDDLDLKNQNIVLKNIELNNTTASVKLGKTEAAKLVEEKAEQVAEKPATPGDADTLTQVVEQNGWRVFVKKIRLDNNNIAFSNDNQPAAKSGMDYAHLDMKALTLHADDFLFSPDSIAGNIVKGGLQDKSGFTLSKLETNFLYAANEAYLKDLLIQTPGTTLRRSVALKYPSIDALSKDIGQLQLNVDLNGSKIQMRDVLMFVPTLAEQPAFANPQSVMYVDGDLSGRVSDLNIGSFRLRAFNNTNVNVRGTIRGLPDANKVQGNLVIGNISTSRQDIELLAPKGALPTTITLPSAITLNGTVSGGMSAANADLNLRTNLGSVAVKGNVSNPTDSINAKYDAAITATDLNLGVIMQNDTMFGPLTATIKAKGTGYDPKHTNATLEGIVNSAMLNRYHYRDLNFGGSLANQKGNFKLDIQDPNLTIDLDASADLAGEFPAIKLVTVIDSINTLPLNFTADTLTYKGRIEADFANVDPNNLKGDLYVSKSQLVTGGQRYQLDTIALSSGTNDRGKFLRLTADGVNLLVNGKYTLTQMGSVVQQAIDPYYTMLSDSAKKDTLDAYDFNVRGEIVSSPTIQAFVPTLTRLEPIKLDGHFITGRGFRLNMNAPMIIMGTNRIEGVRINAQTASDALNFHTSIKQVVAGEALTIYTTNIDAKVADNKVNFLLNFKDIDDKNKYRLGGLFEQPQTGVYALSMNPAQLLLNYDKWTVSDSNLIRLNNGDINIRDFTISRSGQKLSIASRSTEANAPLEVNFDAFRIGTLTAFAKQDTALADGVINGNVVLNDLAGQPTFTSDLTITDLMFQKDTVGTLALKVNNTTENVFAADVRLTGKGNDFAVNGDYTVKPENQSEIDLTMNINQLQMSTIEAISMGAITRASGALTGKFDVGGTPAKPNVNGQLNFRQIAFSPTMLGSYLRLDDERIVVNDRGINFNKFVIKDSSNNEMRLAGWANTTDFMNYKLDLNLTADNFQALSSTKQNSKLFYGQFYFDTDLHIGGTEKSPVIDGSLTVNDKTDMTIVMPSADPGVVEREGIVRFIDADSINMDSTMYLAAMDTLSKTDVTGMNISVNIETSKDAKFTLIIDEANGDFLEIQGTAQLTGGIDPSGKTTLAGNYEIEDGAYQLSINLLKRRFDILKGSKITWLGEPTTADVDLTAVYVANTAPLTLVEDQVKVPNVNVYKQRLPFNVDLILKGELLKPDISFNVRLPDPDSGKYNPGPGVFETVTTRLDLLRQQPSEMNKQVFALLLLNRFIAENPFASSGGDAATPESMARQSVSRILSEQLNNLAADLIAGVDINFDLESSDDYSGGSRANRTDLNVSVSKELLNDRLRVTVGNNFELEGPQNSNRSGGGGLAGNVAVDYLLSKDGRYMLRGFRKNQYEGELDGFIIETGLNFILTFDYDRLRELFHSPKPKKPKRVRTSDGR